MGVRVPPVPRYIVKNTGKIKRPFGICILCTEVGKLGRTAKLTACKATDLSCYDTRSSMFECKYFREKPKKSAWNSLAILFKSLLKSLKLNDWKYLKEAVKNELQD